jgi:hypothetical protein
MRPYLNLSLLSYNISVSGQKNTAAFLASHTVASEVFKLMKNIKKIIKLYKISCRFLSAYSNGSIEILS